MLDKLHCYTSSSSSPDPDPGHNDILIHYFEGADRYKGRANQASTKPEVEFTSKWPLFVLHLLLIGLVVFKV